jgi:hypothetical protein
MTSEKKSRVRRLGGVEQDSAAPRLVNRVPCGMGLGDVAVAVLDHEGNFDYDIPIDVEVSELPS